MSSPHQPPISWSFWRRLRYFGGLALLGAVLVAGLELLFGDISGGRSFNKFTWPAGPSLVAAIGRSTAGIMAGGVGAALLLPLYRRRHGGAIAGVGVYLAMLVGFAVGGKVFGSPGPEPVDSFAMWQTLAVVVGFGVMAALIGTQMRAAAFGEPETGPRDPDEAPLSRD